MRSGRSLLVLLVIAIALGAYIYFVENKRDLSDQPKKEKVFSVESGKINEIEIRTPAGGTTTIRKNGNDWQIVAPVAAAADQSAAGSLASTLESLESDKTLDENPASVTPFGLAPPQMTVSFKTAGDAAPHTLNLGNKTPTGSDVYAQVEGQKKLLLIAAFNQDSLNKTPFDLRDKTVLSFARDTVDSISLEKAGAPAVALAKKGSDWQITAPVALKADSSAVDSLVSRVAQAQMKAVVGGDAAPPSPKDLAGWGLTKPQLTVVIGSGSTRASLAIGGKKDDTTLYARDLSRPVVFTVESGLLTDLDKKADDLRLKDIFSFKSATATAIEITRAGTTYAFTKGKSGTDANATDVWKETKPEAKDVNLTGMTDFLNSLSALRADKFVDKPSGADELAVVVHSVDGAAHTDEAASFKRSGDTVQAVMAGQPGAAVVPTADFDKALTQFKELMGIK